jgi:hypothetical protein
MSPLTLPLSPMGRGRGEGKIRYYLNMKKLQSGDEIVKIDEELGIAWILLPPDASLGGFQGISPRIMDEEKFIIAKNKAKKK